MSQLPQKPWNEGDTFTNDATGVEYTFDGVKWLASGGEELDLSAYLPLSGGEMEPSASIKVNSIAPVNASFIYYDGKESGHPMGLMSRGMIGDFIDEKTEGFASEEYVDNADYLPLSGGTMQAGKAIFVDQIEPVDNTRYIRYEAGADKRYPFALANCRMVQDVAKEIFDEEIAKVPAPAPTVGRRFKYGYGTSPADGYFSLSGGEILFSFVDLDGVVRKHTQDPDFAWTNLARCTIWNSEGELWYAAELTRSTNYATTIFRLYKESVKLDRNLVVDEEYSITIEGYW